MSAVVRVCDSIWELIILEKWLLVVILGADLFWTIFCDCKIDVSSGNLFSLYIPQACWTEKSKLIFMKESFIAYKANNKNSLLYGILRFNLNSYI